MAEDQITFNSPESLPWTCKHCGKGYSRKKTFCSQQCGAQYRYKCQYKISRKNGRKGCHEKICLQCGIFFLGTKKDKCCSRKCKNLRQTKKSESTCKQCGIVFMPKAADRKTFCSRECYYTHIWNTSKASKVQPYVLAYCRCCGKDFPGTLANSSHCSVQCQKLGSKFRERAKTERNIVKRCMVCNKPYKGNRKDVTCSKWCNQERVRHQRLDAKRRRRIKLSACTVVLYSRWDIFKRDDWTCYLCGRNVSGKYRCPNPLTPTIDHVIPIAKGGDDVPDNVKCCCFKCNSEKGDSMEYAFLVAPDHDQST